MNKVIKRFSLSLNLLSILLLLNTSLYCMRKSDSSDSIESDASWDSTKAVYEFKKDYIFKKKEPTMLEQAIKFHVWESIVKMIKMHPEQVQAHHNKAYRLAARQGNHELMQYLLEHGANPLDKPKNDSCAELLISESKKKPENYIIADAIIYADEEEVCPICFERDVDAALTSCDHMFCKKCITMWRKNHTTCPICRKHIISVENIYTGKKWQQEHTPKN